MIQDEYKLNDPTSFRHSKNLFEMPKKAGLAVMKGKKMSLAATYGGKDRLEDYSNLRTYMGHRYLAKKSAGTYKTKKRFPLFFKPDTKVGLKEVFDFFRFRFEGTKYCPETTGRDDVRLIGTESTFNAHVIEIYDKLKPEFGSTAWIALGNCEHSVFLPYSNMLSKVDERFSCFDKTLKYAKSKKCLKDQEDRPILYDEDIAQVCFKRLCLIAEHDREKYGKGVRDYWSKKEEALIKEFPKVIKEVNKLSKSSNAKAQRYLEKWTMSLQNETLEEAKTIFDQLI